MHVENKLKSRKTSTRISFFKPNLLFRVEHTDNSLRLPWFSPDRLAFQGDLQNAPVFLHLTGAILHQLETEP